MVISVLRAVPPPLLPKGQLPHGCVYEVHAEHARAMRRRDLEGIAGLGFNIVVFWSPAACWDAP
ncbi:MAG TPA: hypothetical protein VG963_11310, partial [Polyangiaceae bacterium]|nr:hypothetical protein [Polyangiaceae bacterium]